VGDAGPDGGSFEPTTPEPPALPQIAPCPEGWTEVPEPLVAGLSTCEPWPVGEDCLPGEARFPGDAACAPVGSACPEGDYADDLPAGDVVHVLAGAAAGGDGSVGAPFGAIADALAVAADGSVVAVSKGVFDEVVVVETPVTLHGACARETILASSEAFDFGATLSFATRGGATARNLTVSGERSGIDVDATASPVVLEDVVVSGTIDIALYVRGDLTARDLLVEDTRPAIGGGYGLGLLGADGAWIELDRAAFVRNRHAAIDIVGPDTTLTARDLRLEATAERDDARTHGYGLWLEADATAQVERAAIERNHGAAIRVEGSSLTLSDAVVRGTEAQASWSLGGGGLSTQSGGDVTIARTTFEDNRAGIFVESAGSTMALTDVVVRDVLGSTLDVSGTGINADAQGRIDALRVAVLRVRTAGIRITGEASLEGADVLVASMLSQERDGEFGYGITADRRGGIDLARVAVDGGRHAGAVVFQAGSTLALTDADLGPTLERECVATGCAGGGIGVAALQGGVAFVARFRVHGSALCGVQVATDGWLTLEDGVVESNLIGANVQVDPFDYAAITDRVLYRDNTRDLDATSLPLPAPIGAPGG